MIGRVARRYAKAVFALARDRGALDTVAAELALLRDSFADPALLGALASPMMTATRLTALAKELARETQVSELTANFLGVLAQNRRLDQLPGICDRFQELHDRALGRIRVSIRSAAALTPERHAELVAAFEQRTGKTVLASVEVVPEFLGGVVLEAEGKVYDGSLLTQLERIARGITGTRTYL